MQLIETESDDLEPTRIDLEDQIASNQANGDDLDFILHIMRMRVQYWTIMSLALLMFGLFVGAVMLWPGAQATTDLLRNRVTLTLVISLATFAFAAGFGALAYVFTLRDALNDLLRVHILNRRAIDEAYIVLREAVQ